jgi:hypothetical protein
MNNKGRLDVLDLFRDLIDKMSDDELNQFLDKFRRLRTEKNQAKPDQSKTPECTSASNNSSDVSPAMISEE